MAQRIHERGSTNQSFVLIENTCHIDTCALRNLVIDVRNSCTRHVIYRSPSMPSKSNHVQRRFLDPLSRILHMAFLLLHVGRCQCLHHTCTFAEACLEDSVRILKHAIFQTDDNEL